MKHLFSLVVLGCLASLPSSVQAAERETSWRASTPPSITEHLQMRAESIDRLSRIYDDYASRRDKEEVRIAQWQNQLRQAQAPTSFNQNQAAKLLRDIADEQQQMANDFLDARAKAFKTLTPVQRDQLEAFAKDDRLKMRHDRFYQLLLLPVEDVRQVPLDSNPGPARSSERPYRERSSHDKGSGSYGVYGGYDYGGPNYGVYGNYGRSPVGVHAGVGRYGPSIGIGIGRIFGGRHRW